MIPGKGDGCPVDDLEEGDEAEAKAKSKEAAKRGDELDRSHPYSALHLCNFGFQFMHFRVFCKCDQQVQICGSKTCVCAIMKSRQVSLQHMWSEKPESCPKSPTVYLAY